MRESNTQKGPIISVAVSPRNDGDREKFHRALSVVVQEDPSIRIKKASDDGPTILSGMSEEHLEAICDRLLREFRLQLDIGEPTVIYLETVHRSAEGEGKYIRQTGGAGNYGHVKIRVEPNEPGKGFEFINDIKGGVVQGIHQADRAGHSRNVAGRSAGRLRNRRCESDLV
jgi:elongation factor G